MVQAKVPTYIRELINSMAPICEFHGNVTVCHADRSDRVAPYTTHTLGYVKDAMSSIKPEVEGRPSHRLKHHPHGTARRCIHVCIRCE